MNDETQAVLERYDRRKNNDRVIQTSQHYRFNHYVVCERELHYTHIIKQSFQDTNTLKVLEIGAGTGGNLFFFNRLGFEWTNIYANELNPERFANIKKNLPQVSLFEGDALQIPINEPFFDIVFQSTVFTSILDTDFKVRLAQKMWQMLNKDGIILWYDFAFDNPANKDVKGVKKAEIHQLFPHASTIKTQRVTLAPPIGRRIGNLYPFFNLLPFLRTHLIAVIKK